MDVGANADSPWQRLNRHNPTASPQAPERKGHDVSQHMCRKDPAIYPPLSLQGARTAKCSSESCLCPAVALGPSRAEMRATARISRADTSHAARNAAAPPPPITSSAHDASVSGACKRCLAIQQPTSHAGPQTTALALRPKRTRHRSVLRAFGPSGVRLDTSQILTILGIWDFVLWRFRD